MPEITKRRVEMKNAVILPDGTVAVQTATDYVRPDFLDAYVAKARERWQSVVVSDEPDAGPGGYYGATAVPADIDHPLAGTLFPAEPDPDAPAADVEA